MTPDIILNIGLDVENGDRLTLDQVAAAVKARFPGATIALELAQSDTEPTAVVSLSGRLMRRIAFRLSEDLRQDCIAYRLADGRSGLLGPHADKWLPFDASKFIMPTPPERRPRNDSADAFAYAVEGLKAYGGGLGGGKSYARPIALSEARDPRSGEIIGMWLDELAPPGIDWRAEAQKLVDAIGVYRRAINDQRRQVPLDAALAAFEAVKAAADATLKGDRS